MSPPEILSLAEREREYSPSSCIGGDYLPFIRAYRDRSNQARRAARQVGARWRREHYGALANQYIDVCTPSTATDPPKSAGCPLLVFIHGGYWQALSSDDSLFFATECVQDGVAFAAINYTLAPDAALLEIVDECIRAVAWLHAHADALGVDRTRIVVAGSSAGAHLAAMVALPSSVAGPWVSATVLVSGVYDLFPLLGTSINEAVGLDAASAHAASPVTHPLHGFPRSVLAWGAIETASFKMQSRLFSTALASVGTPTECFEVPDRNHFDVVFDLTNPATALGRRVWSLLQRT